MSDNENLEIIKKFIFNKLERDIYNGFAQPSLDKLKNLILFFIDKCGRIYQTKLNKLLFYTDFYSFKTNGIAITGLTYTMTDYGPTPQCHHWLYEKSFKEIKPYNSIIGYHTKTELTAIVKPDLSVFSENEIQIMNHIYSTLGQLSGYKIASLDFKDDSWKAKIGHDNLLDFSYAFSLKAI